MFFKVKYKLERKGDSNLFKIVKFRGIFAVDSVYVHYSHFREIAPQRALYSKDYAKDFTREEIMEAGLLAFKNRDMKWEEL